MDVAITGATGLVGSRLLSRLETSGHQVRRIVRSSPSGSDILWNPTAGELDVKALEGIDAVVHLAGESIAEGRWTAAKKERIRDSRVVGTRLLCESLSELASPPKALVSASAIGYYGSRGDQTLTETDQAGQGYLPEVCVAWEAATESAQASSIRVVNLRIGMVLSGHGGALAKMLLPFRLGVGGRVGSGKQWWSWIAMSDLLGTIEHALLTDSLAGPVNAVSPNPVTNSEFTKTLGRVLRRPTLIPIPGFAARIVFGQMADGLLLASARVESKRLVEAGYEFTHPTLEQALRHELGR